MPREANTRQGQLPGEARSLRFDATSRYLLTGNGTIYVPRLAPPPNLTGK
jgi:hypothetical protein